VTVDATYLACRETAALMAPCVCLPNSHFRRSVPASTKRLSSSRARWSRHHRRSPYGSHRSDQCREEPHSRRTTRHRDSLFRTGSELRAHRWRSPADACVPRGRNRPSTPSLQPTSSRPIGHQSPALAEPDPATVPRRHEAHPAVGAAFGPSLTAGPPSPIRCWCSALVSS
jgi:hypothetical protein